VTGKGTTDPALAEANSCRYAIKLPPNTAGWRLPDAYRPADTAQRLRDSFSALERDAGAKLPR